MEFGLSFLAPLAGNWLSERLTGKSISEHLAPPKNPAAAGQTALATQRQQMGNDILTKYMPMLTGAAENRVKTLQQGYGQNQLGKLQLGMAQTGADRAFGRAKSNLSLGLQRRGLGGGVLAGGLSNLEGQRANTMANTYNQNAQQAILQDRNAQQQIMDTYGWLANLGNSLGNQGGQQLMNLGQMEQQRQMAGQDGLNQALQMYTWLQEMQKKKAAGGGVPIGSSGSYEGNWVQDQYGNWVQA